MTITEVGKLLDISVNTLRYYEQIGLIPKVQRTKGGMRNYTEEDLHWIDFAKCMRGAGLQTRILTNYVALAQQGDSTQEERRQILLAQLDQLLTQQRELEKTIEQLNHEIERHERTILISQLNRKTLQSLMT